MSGVDVLELKEVVSYVSWVDSPGDVVHLVHFIAS